MTRFWFPKLLVCLTCSLGLSNALSAQEGTSRRAAQRPAPWAGERRERPVGTAQVGSEADSSTGFEAPAGDSFVIASDGEWVEEPTEVSDGSLPMTSSDAVPSEGSEAVAGDITPQSADCPPDGKPAAAEKSPAEKAKDKQKELEGKVKGAYKNQFFNNDFEYLLDPDYNGSHLGESFKRMELGNGLLLDIGGQYRWRYHDERRIRGLGLTGRDDNFYLHRTRLYGNLQYNDLFRIYAEGMDAASFGENFAPRGIEENRYYMQNLFGDVKLWGAPGGADFIARVGRQELAFGNERLVSTLDWANTRRSFEGYNLIYKKDGWNANLFWTHPLPAQRLDKLQPDNSEEFMGLFASNTSEEDSITDYYFYRFIETDAPNFEFNTFGYNSYSKPTAKGMLHDFELAGQFGDVNGVSQNGWAFTYGMGKKLGEDPLSPSVWGYYDYATGDDSGNGFHHLFPLAHKYLGFMDLFGRRNIQDWNAQYNLPLNKQTSFLVWYHSFHQQNDQDGVYDVLMRRSVAPNAFGNGFLGQELDFLLTYNVTPRSSLVGGYSHFFTGRFYKTHQDARVFRGDADFFYLQFSQQF